LASAPSETRSIVCVRGGVSVEFSEKARKPPSSRNA